MISSRKKVKAACERSQKGILTEAALPEGRMWMLLRILFAEYY
jgi:hypothetical protein